MERSSYQARLHAKIRIAHFYTGLEDIKSASVSTEYGQNQIVINKIILWIKSDTFHFGTKFNEPINSGIHKTATGQNV